MGIFNFKKNGNKVKRGDILKTTDGFLGHNIRNKKERPVVVYNVRKDDGALAISKIHRKAGKDTKNYIPKLDLSPKKHTSLTEVSVIEKRVIFGVKDKDNNYKSIYGSDLTKTNDKLKLVERCKYNKSAGGDTKQNKKTLKTTTKKWKRHFRQ